MSEPEIPKKENSNEESSNKENKEIKPPKTDIELKQLAIDIYDQKVFTSNHIGKHEANMISMVFMPLALGAGFSKEEIDAGKVGMLYEYYDKAAPKGINGLPIFYSFHYISVEEMYKVNIYYNQYKKLKETFASMDTQPKETKDEKI